MLDSPMNLLRPRQSPSSTLTEQFQEASWIYSEPLNLTAPAIDRAFRATYSPSSGLYAVSTSVLITADDYFTLYINGQQVGDTRTLIGTDQTVWADVHGYSVTLNVNGAAPIVFGIIVSNNANSPSGLLAAMQLTLSDGSTATMSSGGTGWRSSESVPQNFQSPSFDDSGWATPVVLSKNGADDPWGSVSLPSSLVAVSLSPSQVASAPSSTAELASSSTTTQGGNQNPTTTAGPASATTVGSGSSTGGSSNGGSIVGTAHSVSGTASVVSGSSIYGATGVSAVTTSSSTSLSGASSPVQSSTHTSSGVIAGGVVGGICLILLLALIWFLCLRRRKPAREDSTTATSPLVSEVQESIHDPTRPTPFTLLSSSPVQSDSQPSGGVVRKDWGGIGYQDVASPASTSSDGVRTQDLNATLEKLQGLAEELNRGLASQGVNAPRIALTVSDPQGTSSSASAGLSELHVDGGPLPPPYMDRRLAS
ncbi:hypothetical protein H0H92_005133 [Tricholoma furcatifolium]|nr:hypothetical protein H0H92_005133 [Tricholoma furcatifolium]